MIHPAVCASFRRMRHHGAALAAALTVLATVLGTPNEARAQAVEERFSLAARVGFATASGAFGDYTSPATSAALRFAYNVRPSTSWFVEGGLDAFRDRELKHQVVTGPSMDALRLLTGVEFEVIPEDLSGYENVSLRVRGGLGLQKLDSDTFRLVGGTEDLSFSSTSVMAGAGLALGYIVRPGITLIFDAGVNWAKIDEEKTQDLADLAPFYVHTFSSAFSFPYSVGVRIGF